MPRCPGLDTRFLKMGVHKCPHCGYEVEIFSDEIRVRCPKCKRYVYRDKVPSCVDWCRYARDCLGEERWKELKERMDEQQEKEGAKGGKSR